MSPNPIIVGIDGSPESARAAAVAWQLAQAMGIPCRVLHVVNEEWAALVGAQLSALPEVRHRIVRDAQGALAAYVQLRPGAPPEGAAPGPIELWRFYVDAAHHGRGLAQRLMAAAFEAAATRGATTMWLGVWERNFRAQAFYRKFGFVEIGRHTFTLGRDRQTDLLMARPIG